MKKKVVRIIHVEDEADYTKLVAKVLEQIDSPTFIIDWISNYQQALEELYLNKHDLCLIDQNLGEKTGLQLIKEAKQKGCNIPFVLLTGFGNRQLDFEAMESGADAYLEKSEISTPVFERIIRYTIERYQHESELLRVKEQLNTIVDESDFARWEWNTVTNELNCPQTSSVFLGYHTSYDFLNHRDWNSVRHPDDIPKALIALEDYTQGKSRYYEAEQRLLDSNGHWKWVLERGKAIDWDKQQRPIKLTGFYFDINEFKQNEQELLISKETSKRLMRVMKSLHEQTTNYAKQAEHSNQIKSEFLANMSHDIRTPLTTIESVTELLMKDELPEEQRDYLESISESSHSLMDLVENILDLSKIESGNFTLESKLFNLEDAIYEIIEVLFPKIGDLQVELICDIAPIHHYLKGDLVRLKQVLTNLLTNALKFTAKGEIALVIEIVEEKNNQLQLLFTVCDTGIGLEQDQIEEIFLPFKQAKPKVGHQIVGTGLGLAICKQIVEMMGGQIQVESRPMGGTTFRFFLEFGIGRSLEPYWRDDSEKVKDKHILIVDDCSRNYKLFERLSSELGVQVDYCISLDEANKKIDKAVYDVLFVDVQLLLIHSEKKWIESIKANQSDQVKHIIGLFNSIDQRKNQKLTFTRSLIKPLAYKKIVMTLKYLFEETGKEFSPDNREIFLKQELRSETILLVEDQKTSQMVGKKIINQCGFPVVLASDGQEALEKALNRSFDLIFMDVEMPKFDGLEVTRRLRTQDIKTPIIALTAHVLKDNIQKYFDAGMTDYISKPLRRHAVRFKLARYLNISDLEQDQIISNLKTLVVHDNPKQLADMLQNFRTLWSKETFKHASSGIEAAILIGRFQPNLLVLKMELPDLNGYQLVRNLMQDERYHNMKMILLTSDNKNYHINKLRQKGKIDILDEHPEFDNLEIAIRKLYASGETEDSVQESAELIIDEKSASLGFNSVDYKIVLESFLKATSNNLKNLDQAIQQNNEPDLKRLVHSIKGSAKTIKFDNIALVAEKMEDALFKKDRIHIEQYFSKLVKSFDEMQQTVVPQLVMEPQKLEKEQSSTVKNNTKQDILKKLMIELETMNQKRNITAVISLSDKIGLIAESMNWIELVHQALLVQRYAKQADFKSVNFGIERLKGMVQ